VIEPVSVTGIIRWEVSSEINRAMSMTAASLKTRATRGTGQTSPWPQDRQGLTSSGSERAGMTRLRQ
jgi:hypothetical protein